jgi:hypothetical protein
MPRSKATQAGPIGAAKLRDPRITWLFILVSLIMLLFACILVVIGDNDQRSFVNPLFGVSATFLAAGGFIKFDLASIFGAKKAD